MTQDLFEEGIVAQSFPDREIYSVVTDKSGLEFTGCRSLVGGVFLPFLGFNTHARLAVGTRVMLMKVTPAYILCCLPTGVPDMSAGYVDRATTGEADISDLGSEEVPGLGVFHGAPTDMLEGEFNITNVFQVGIRFLTHLVKMQAGDRAKVECFVLDDLVRIVSENFHHMSAFGDFRVTNDHGRLNCRTDGTSYEHEAHGILEPKDPRVKSATDDKLPDTPIAETGRWRFTQFVGQLGDFIHMFITDPGAALGELAQERAGKFHAHVHNDGSLVVQSLADICLERVTRITVPVEQKRYDDSTGDQVIEPSSDFLDTWKLDPQRPWTLAYHLREYARWLNSYHAYARFLRQSQDWSVPSEAASPAPEYSAREKDREAAIPAAHRSPRVTYSCIRIMRDGSQVLADGYGSVITQAGGTTTIAAPIDVRIEAGRNIILTAGKSIFCKARHHVEIVAVMGALILKARTRFSALCERGTVLLKTFMTAGAATDATPAQHRFGDNKVGIVLSAPDADVILSAGRQMTVEGVGKEVEENQTGVRIQSSLDNVEIATSKDGAIKLTAMTLSARVSDMVLTCSRIFTLNANLFDMGQVLFKSTAGLIAPSLRALQLAGKQIFHGTEIKRGQGSHTNHVYFTEVEVEIPDLDEASKTAMNDPALPAQQKGKEEAAGARGDYLPAAEYPTDPLPQSMMQQLAVHSPTGEHPAGVIFDEWKFADDSTDGDPQAVHKLPFPGARGKMEFFPSNALLHKMSEATPDTFTPTPTKPEIGDAVFQAFNSQTPA